jgi:hypothetical protein
MQETWKNIAQNVRQTQVVDNSFRRFTNTRLGTQRQFNYPTSYVLLSIYLTNPMTKDFAHIYFGIFIGTLVGKWANIFMLLL